jgi:hypothetical protein
MTVRKANIILRGDRVPAYVDRLTGAAELSISPDTWDNWVREKILPPPCIAFPTGTPRWRWQDVDKKLSGQDTTTPIAANDDDPAIKGAAYFGPQTRNRRRGTAEGC